MALGGILWIAPGATLPGDDLGRLKVALKDSNKWARKTAVEKLARLGTREAWEQVVGALDDRTGEVADTAQLLLAELADPSLLEGRRGLGSRDEWVRRRAVEVLGRMSAPLDERSVLGALRDDDSEVRRMACWSIERRASELRNEKVVDAVVRTVGRDRDPAVRARALYALVRLDPTVARAPLVAAARDHCAALRCVAAEQVPDEETLVALARDPSFAVRTRAALSLAGYGTRTAALALVERLEAEEEVRLRLRLVEHLRRLSGLKHRDDARPWRDWVERLPAGWHAPLEGGAEGADEPFFEGRTVALAGLPILSGRIAFLIDLSGSIWHEREDGHTKKEIIDGKLAEVLERLPESTLFNVIPYTGAPHPWRDELVPATKKNVRDAIASFERCREQGSGNFWDAALLALEDPEVDTLLVLTDGLPTGGRRYQLELIVPLFLELNATRQVAVDSILVDAPKKLRGHWADLAAGTGGRSIAIEL